MLFQSNICLLSPSSCDFSCFVLSVVALRHLPASCRPYSRVTGIFKPSSQKKALQQKKDLEAAILHLFIAVTNGWRSDNTFLLLCRFIFPAHVPLRICVPKTTKDHKRRKMSELKTNKSSFDCTCETMLALYSFCSVQELWVGVKKTKVGYDFSPVLVMKTRGIILLFCMFVSQQGESRELNGSRTSKICELQHKSGLWSCESFFKVHIRNSPLNPISSCSLYGAWEVWERGMQQETHWNVWHLQSLYNKCK